MFCQMSKNENPSEVIILPVDGATAHDPDVQQNRLMFLVFMFHASFSDHVPTVYQIKNINQKLICNIATHCTFVCTTITRCSTKK